MSLPLSFPNMVTARISDKQLKWLNRNGGVSLGIREAIDTALRVGKSQAVMKKVVGKAKPVAKKAPAKKAAAKKVRK